MRIERNELSQMPLQRLAYVLPQDMEEENLVKEIFEQRASVSTYLTLTSIDVKQGWQEAILQKYIDIRRETMAPENAATLTGEDQKKLDANVITKEIELELQAKLDKKNGRVKIPEAEIVIDPNTSTDTITVTGSPESVETDSSDVTTKKRGRPAKK